MKYSARTRSAGGQQWHRIRPGKSNVRFVGVTRPEWLHVEKKVEENLQAKKAMKDQVRESLKGIDPDMITVIPAGKRKKRGK